MENGVVLATFPSLLMTPSVVVVLVVVVAAEVLPTMGVSKQSNDCHLDMDATFLPEKC